MRRQRSKTHPAASLPRSDRGLHSQEMDVYGLRGKLPDPTVCPTCGALYRDGRWTWGAAPVDAHPTECPACRRTADRYPAGRVRIRGDFARAHADEIRGLVRNVEEREKAEHALKRVMAIEDDPGEDGLEVTTTDAKLAKSIGEALHSAYAGELDYDFTQVENVMRVDWRR
jgi:NMD protein affecting ribosome stability and mRNA decay